MSKNLKQKMMFKNGENADLCIVGGAGHVGLPLAIVFASKGMKVLINDVDGNAIETIKQGQIPFMEDGAEPLLKQALKDGNLLFSQDSGCLQETPVIIVTIGTPVDEFQNPDYRAFKRWVDNALPYLCDGQLIILRSTVYPGTTHWLQKYLLSKKIRVKVSFCPERIVQGHAIKELKDLPQIVSGTTSNAIKQASALFGKIAPEVVELQPLEAEFAKLFANAYRYIQFAIANQFYMICHSAGVDYYNVLEGLKRNYPRSADIPSAGFAAGPCLYKDTMQLSAFSKNQFFLGHSAMLINEGIVLYIVDHILKDLPIHKMTIGLLGMAFKANNDDIRSSLSYKLKKILELQAEEVLITDPHVTMDKNIIPLEEVIDRSDLLILCAPHNAYKGIDTKGKQLIDIWGFMRDDSVKSRKSSSCSMPLAKNESE